MPGCTTSGRIIYKRKPHIFRWSDVRRIVRGLDGGECMDSETASVLEAQLVRCGFSEETALRRRIRELTEQVENARQELENALELASQSRLALLATIWEQRREIRQLLRQLEECSPDDSGFGGAGATRSFGTREQSNRSIPEDERVIPDLPGETRGEPDNE